MSITENRGGKCSLMLHVVWSLAFRTFSSTILNCAGNKKHITHYLLEF